MKTVKAKVPNEAINEATEQQQQQPVLDAGRKSGSRDGEETVKQQLPSNPLKEASYVGGGEEIED